MPTESSKFCPGTKQLIILTAGYSQIAGIFPLIVISPRYFAKEIPLGVMTQTAGAFGRVQGALSFLIDSYVEIATWQSVVQRLAGFDDAIASVRRRAAETTGFSVDHSAQSIVVDQVQLLLPNGTKLLSPLSLTITPGQSALITGPSGSGKSTLIRTRAGICPYAEGRLSLPPTDSLLFLP